MPRSKPDPSRPSDASENARLPHVLDLLEHQRVRTLWIAAAHCVVIVVALGVVWWATRSTGTKPVHASGWPTGDSSPKQGASGWPDEAIRPERSQAGDSPVSAGVRKESNDPAVRIDAPLANRPTQVLDLPANAESPTGPTEPPALEVIPRLVEYPDNAGLFETFDDANDRPSSVDSELAVNRNPWRANTDAPAVGLPPGGIRPTRDGPQTPVAWVEPEANGENSPSDVALTTGQVQIDTSANQELVAESEPANSAPRANEGLAVNDAAPKVSEETTPIEPSVKIEAEPELPREFMTGSFYGLPTGPRTVYLIDASGSLLDTLPFAIEELYRAVRTLDDRQAYAVVFFNGDGLIEAEPLGMQPATRTNLTQTLTWLEPRLNHVRAKGRPDAADALAHALKLRPDTIVLLSDGVTGLRDPAADRRALVTLLERFGRDVRLHTVQFIDPDPLATRGRLGTLELLSSLTGGRHRFVGLQEVRPKPRPRASF